MTGINDDESALNHRTKPVEQSINEEVNAASGDKKLTPTQVKKRVCRRALEDREEKRRMNAMFSLDCE